MENWVVGSDIVVLKGCEMMDDETIDVAAAEMLPSTFIDSKHVA